MKCPNCDGMGFVYNALGAFSEDCGLCHGTGQIQDRFNAVDILDVMKKVKQPQTNEEWLRSCPPQELIRFLMNVAYGGQIRSVQKSTFDEEAEKWSKWLKEIH